MAPVGRWGKKGRVFWLSERNGERLKSRHRYCIIERSEFGKAGGLFQLTFCPLSDDSQLRIFLQCVIIDKNGLLNCMSYIS